MEPGELKDSFDQQASSYDQKWSRLAAFRDSLQLLIGSAFKRLPADARVLCVGAGTGAEIVDLAARFPRWTFTAVEPSARMLDVGRRRASHGAAASPRLRAGQRRGRAQVRRRGRRSRAGQGGRGP